MSEQLSLFRAREEAKTGMQRAEQAADRIHPGWPDLAYSFLVSFARRHELFISEDVSGASKDSLPQPATDRAWGMIYRRAIKAGIIVQDGMGRSARRHASICPRWRSRIFQ